MLRAVRVIVLLLTALARARNVTIAVNTILGVGGNGEPLPLGVCKGGSEDATIAVKFRDIVTFNFIGEH